MAMLELTRHTLGALVRGRVAWGRLVGRGAGPVFGVGRNKTGTTSLAAALRALGYKVAPQRPAERLLRDWHAGDFRRLLWFCRLYGAYQDIPFSLPGTYAVLDKAFPQARFILTIRANAQEWYDSMLRFTTRRIGKGRIPTAADLAADTYVYPGWSWENHRLIYQLESDQQLFDPERYQAHYLEHNRAVIDHFRGRPGKLLVLDVAEPNAMARLAEFLGHEPPAGLAFPWENQGKTLKR